MSVQGRLSPTGAAAPVPRKSRLAPPSLPTVIGSPRQTNKVSVIYEDGASYAPASARTSSFITAPSVSLNTPTAEPGQRFSFGELGPHVYLDPSSFASDSARGESMSTDADDTPNATHPSQRLPAGLYDDVHGANEFGQMVNTRPNSRSSLRPDNPTPPSTHSRSRNSSLLAPGSSALRTRSASPADESFLDRRWLKGLSFGSQRLVFSPPGEQERRVSCAFVLFCVGFIMPWCWLIGGWLLTRDGEVQEEERGSVLPLWHKRQTPPLKRAAEKPFVKADDKRRADADVAAGQDVQEKKAKTSSWYPLLAPSLESLTPPNKDSKDTTPTRRLRRCFRSTRRADPWITRCRVAAAVSGILLLAACIVAIVFAAGVRG